MEWSSSTFDDYELTTAEVSVSCSGNDGTANGSFRLMLDTSDNDYAAVQVSIGILDGGATPSAVGDGCLTEIDRESVRDRKAVSL